MISYHEALSIILEAGSANQLGAEDIGIEEIAGRICAQDVRAIIANQPFDNSAMDGFALRAEDIQAANSIKPLSLKIIGRIAAGDMRAYKAPVSGQCYEIMTGAPLPPGCNAVVPVEQVEKLKETIAIFRHPAVSGDNIRRIGEDFSIGDRILDRGVTLNPGHVLVLATSGVGKIKVIRSPMAGLISTGQEIVDEIGSPLKLGQIYNSTGPYLRAMLPQMGVESRSYGTVHDDSILYKNRLEKALNDKCNLIISTGAVSAGAYDFVPGILKDMGAEILFHKVAIRPGKPILFARFPSGGQFYFGLPGNPVSGAVGLRFFIQPLLRAMQGLLPEEPQYAILTRAFEKGKKDLTFFMRASLQYTEKGAAEAEIPGGQQSFKVSPFIMTNAWVEIPQEVVSLAAGQAVLIYQ